MKGTFTYHNPCRLHFGPKALDMLADELAEYGPTVLLAYGGGSIKRIGLYDQVTEILAASNKMMVELPGIMSNPTVEKLYEGCKLARENDVDLILAVGGGSVVDYSKALGSCAWCEGDPWERYYLNNEKVTNRIIPVGDILTMSATGSEMNGGAVITHTEQKLKIDHSFAPEGIPQFTIINPEWNYSLPDYQVKAGIFDTFNHIQEQYFCGDDENVSDYVSEALMKSLIAASYAAMENPEDYEARSNICWISTWALNHFIDCGKSSDWEVHSIGQSIGAVTDATHGMTLSAIAPTYYRYIMPYGLHKFVRFATEVFGVDPADKTDEQVALEGLDAMESWMRDIGLVMNITDLGLTEDMFDVVVKGSFERTGGYKTLSPDEVRMILEQSR